MPGLVLELKQDDLIVINGAVIRFRNKSRIEINGKARFLFGKQVLLPDDARTPARRIYMALQTSYVGNDHERITALVEAKELIGAFRAGSGSLLAQEMLDRMLALASSGDCYEALKLARSVIRHEDSLLKVEPPVVGTGTPTLESVPRQPVPPV